MLLGGGQRDDTVSDHLLTEQRSKTDTWRFFLICRSALTPLQIKNVLIYFLTKSGHTLPCSTLDFPWMFPIQELSHPYHAQQVTFDQIAV